MPDADVYRGLLALSPAQCPLDPVTHTTSERDGLVTERVSFAAATGERAPALFVRPADSSGPLPGIVALHCHGGFFAYGKEKLIAVVDEPESVTTYKGQLYGGRSFGTDLARRGFAVLAIDAHFFGERRREDLLGPAARKEIAAAGGAPSVAGARLLDHHLTPLQNEVMREVLAGGRIWPGVILAEDIRSIDYLVSRSEVDPERIGCMGLSLGGFRSALLAALDNRIKAAVVAGWMCDFADLEAVHRNNHTWMVYVPRLTAHGDLTGLTGLLAPRSLLVQQCIHDTLFPLAGMRAACERLGRTYREQGCAERFESQFYDNPHELNAKMQADAFAWLVRHLQGGSEDAA